MPNIKSAKKRVEVIKTKTAQNNMIKTKCKTAVKKLDTAITNKENIEDAFKVATKTIDKACAKGIINKNAASRKKSQLAKKLNSAEVVITPAKKTATKKTTTKKATEKKATTKKTAK